jgi:multidrug efflux system membrane fusion protein
MRVMPLLTAALVVAALYALVFERARVLELAGLAPRPGEAAADDPGAGRMAAMIDAGSGAAEAAGAPAGGGGGDRRVRVVAIASVAREIESAVILRGRTEAARSVDVMAETSGRVISEPLRRGARVAAEEALCILDPGTRAVALAEARARLPEAEARLTEAEARLVEARARLAEAEIEARAARQLSAGGFAAETRVAAAEAALESARAGVRAATAGVEGARAGIESARAAVARAEWELGRLAITAPFAGLLETDTAELGALLQPGALCATVIALDPVKLVGFVPESEVERVRVGARAGARLASGREVAGRVTFLSRSADPATRTFRVEVEVPNPDLAIRDGQTAEIAIAGDGQPAHLVPASALTLDDDGRLGVRLVVDGRARFHPVTPVRDTANGVWLSGLPERADVIVVGQEFVTDGVAVDVTWRGAEP